MHSCIRNAPRGECINRNTKDKNQYKNRLYELSYITNHSEDLELTNLKHWSLQIYKQLRFHMQNLPVSLYIPVHILMMRIPNKESSS